MATVINVGSDKSQKNGVFGGDLSVELFVLGAHLQQLGGGVLGQSVRVEELG
jgi:hypothetical protein